MADAGSRSEVEDLIDLVSEFSLCVSGREEQERGSDPTVKSNILQ